MKYGIWLDEWFRNYIQPSSKIKTCERYSEIIEKHLKVKLGEYELDELTPLVLQRYVTELMQSGNIVTGKGLAANSVNGIITVIQNSLKLAYTLGELKEYTADKIKRPKTKEKEVSCFSLAEQKKIEQAALSSKKRKFIGIVIRLYSGLRIGELLALTWSDIDFTKGTLAVNKTCHDGPDLRGCIIHSDRGSQYTSEIYRNAISKYGIIQSMNSAGGRCHDNARCESMWARMKEELLYGRYNTEKLTIEELKTIIWRYFMSYWNNRRICTANGGLPPMEKRRRYELSAKRVA